MQIDGNPVSARVPSAFRALGYRAYRMFWIGAAVSQVGSLMQSAALAWIVASETHSALRTTLITLATLAPIVLLGPWAGALADRQDRRVMLLWCTVLGLLQGLATWIAWISGAHGYLTLFSLSLMLGVLTAITSPSWQSFLADLVPPDALQNAVMLNSTQVNLARAIGPMLAGLIIAHTGPAWCFMLNVVSFFATLWALVSIPKLPERHRSSGDTGIIEGFRIALQHTRERRGLASAIIAHFVFATVAIPVTSLTPIIAVTVLHRGAGSYGLLAGAIGIGAIIGAMVMGTIDRRVPPSRLLIGGTILGVIGLSFLAFTRHLAWALPLLGLYGIAYLSFTSINLSTIQRLSHPRIRGRVASLWMMSYGIGLPTGLVVQGVLADRWGVRTMLGIDAVLLGVAAVVAMVSRGLDPMDRDPSTF